MQTPFEAVPSETCGPCLRRLDALHTILNFTILCEIVPALRVSSTSIMSMGQNANRGGSPGSLHSWFSLLVQVLPAATCPSLVRVCDCVTDLYCTTSASHNSIDSIDRQTTSASGEKCPPAVCPQQCLTKPPGQQSRHCFSDSMRRRHEPSNYDALSPGIVGQHWPHC